MGLQPFEGFVGPTDFGSDTWRNSERLVNFYIDSAVSGTNPKTKYTLIGTPGISFYCSYPSAMGTSANGRGYLISAIFSVSGGGQFNEKTFYITPAYNGAHLLELQPLNGMGQGSYIDRGALPFFNYVSPSKQWKAVASPTQMLIIANGDGCIYDPNALTITSLVGVANWPHAIDATYQDGYFAVIPPGSQRFYISNYQNGLVWNALDYALENDVPDTLTAIFSHHRELWVFGNNRYEIWSNTGNANFPFQRNNSAGGHIGCIASETVQEIADSLIWLGRDASGAAGVFQAVGYQPRKISTPGIDELIRRDNTQQGSLGETATAVSFTRRGHSFYSLTLKNLNVTLLYDVTSGFWSEWASTPGYAQYQPSKVQAVAYNRYLGQVFIADSTTQQIGVLADVPNEWGGNAIYRTRIAPHLNGFGKRLFYRKMIADMSPSANVTINWSDAGMNADQFHGGFGPNAISPDPGSYTDGNRTKWSRLGSSYNDRIFRLDVTDNYYIPTVINAVLLDVE